MWRTIVFGLISSLAVISEAAIGGPSRDFHTHIEVIPRLKDPKNHGVDIVSTSVEGASHLDGLSLEVVEAANADHKVLFNVDLTLNRDLIPQKYFQKYHKKGQVVIEHPPIHQVELCHYQGYLKQQKSTTWAAISTCNGTIQGVIHDGQELWHLSRDDQGSHHLYQHSHQQEQNFTCGYKDPSEQMIRPKRDISNKKQESSANDLNEAGKVERLVPPMTLKGPWNANKRSRYVELVLVVDNQEYVEHKEDLELVYRICKDVANVMNALYSPLNIYIALVGVVVWTEYDEITLSTDGDTTLKNFLHYRKERLVKDHPNDNAQLLTGIQFEGGVVGKALKGPICTYEFSGGVNMWHSDVVGLVATTVAHEMGHNFGMDHDKEECECPDDKCIMAPASSTMKPTFWSSCSLEYLALAFEHGMDYCLRNKPERLFDSPVCGNSFVEAGEECDCGLKDHCDNPCCNPETCTLFVNATCATGACCDFNTCKPKSPGSHCRPAEHECDLPEYCDGLSETCPSDVFKVDGMSCKVGTSFCYKGSCRTHSDQCRLLWGPSGKKSDNQCYEQNRKGTRHGNCGYNRINDSFIQCSTEDVRCGMLHCQHLNERLEFGTESAAILSHSFINSGGRIIPCRTALVDLGLNDVDPGLAPEGARCDDDSLCVNQKCMPVAALTIGPLSCPEGCKGHGMCNSKGHCHCDIGYAPPFCDIPGAGGSIDSGPGSNSEDATSAWLTFLYVVLLLLVPLALVIVFVYYKTKKDDWKLLVEKAKPRKRLTEAEIGASFVTTTEAAASGGGPKSGTSSPTQALLPHVDTSTSALSTVMSEKVQGEASAATSRPKSGLFASISKKRPNFMQNLAKSISLPSPKLRAAMKQQKTVATYEIKVEHQVPREDLSSPSSEDEMVKTSSKDSVLFIKEEKVNVQTVTTTVEQQPPLTVSKSLTTFGTRPIRSTMPMSSSFRSASLTSANSEVTNAIAQLKKVKATTTTSPTRTTPPTASSTTTSPTSSTASNLVLSSLSPTSASAALSVAVEKSSGSFYSQDPKLAFPHSSSFAGRVMTAFTPASTTKAASKVGSSQSAGSLSSNATSAAAATGNKTADTSSLGNNGLKAITIKSDTKFQQDAVTASKTKKAPPPPPKPISLKQQPQNKTSKDATSVKKSPSPPKTSPATEVAPTAAAKVTPTPSPTTTTATTMPLLSKTSTLPSRTTSGSEKKPTSMMSKSSTLPLVPTRPVIGKPIFQTATPSAASLISKSHSTGVSHSSILTHKDRPELDNLIKPLKDRASRGVVFCDPLTLPSPTNPNNPPIIHLQPKTVTTPPAVTSPAISVTFPINPITEAATSEVKAVVVSSVITPTWSTEPKAVTSNIVLCHIDDTDSAPSSEAGSPKKAVIEAAPIASPEESDMVPDKTAKSNKGLSKLKSKLVKRSQSEKKERRLSKDLQQQQQLVESGLSSPTSSVRSQEAPPRPERGQLRKLDISGPILQTNVEMKGNFIPVSRFSESDTESKPAASTRSTDSPSPSHKKAKAPQPPPVVPRRSDKSPSRSEKKASKRPSSIATTRPSRPSAPPPRPPPQRPNVGGSPTRSDTSSLASNDSSSIILMTSSKKPQPAKIDSAPMAVVRATASTTTTYSEAAAGSRVSPVTSPLSLDDFDTPLSSPIMARRSPDALSTTSSSDGDLMREILAGLDTTVKDEVSTLMRKKNKNKKAVEEANSSSN